MQMRKNFGICSTWTLFVHAARYNLGSADKFGTVIQLEGCFISDSLEEVNHLQRRRSSWQRQR